MEPRREDESMSNEDGDSSAEHSAPLPVPAPHWPRPAALCSSSSSSLPGSSASRERLVIEANGVVYECVSRSGKGSFGVVYKAVTRGSGQVVAIKRVLQDPRYKVCSLTKLSSSHSIRTASCRS